MENLEEIERYCENKMTAGERTDFERRLIMEPDLQEELELYKKVVTGIKDSGKEEELRQQLRKVDEQMDLVVPSSKARKNKFFYFAAAASVALIIGFSYLLINHSTSNKISKFEEMDIGMPVLMGGLDNVEFSKGMSFYKQEQYDSALFVFDKLALVKQTDTLLYYKGVVYYEKGDYQNATSNFQDVVNHFPMGIFYNKANYRLGLSLWRQGKVEEANELFKGISANNNSPFKEKAKEILKVL